MAEADVSLLHDTLFKTFGVYYIGRLAAGSGKVGRESDTDTSLIFLALYEPVGQDGRRVKSFHL